MKYILLLCVITLGIFAYAKPSCPGCTTDADPKKSEQILNKSLTTLAAFDGPFYKLVKINSATTGSKDVINADLEDQDGKIKTCDIEIWSKWYGIHITFDCPGEEKLEKIHSP